MLMVPLTERDMNTCSPGSLKRSPPYQTSTPVIHRNMSVMQCLYATVFSKQTNKTHLLNPAGQQRVGGGGVWKNRGSADHDRAGQALPKPQRLHFQSSRSLNVTFPPLLQHLTS